MSGAAHGPVPFFLSGERHHAPGKMRKLQGQRVCGGDDETHHATSRSSSDGSLPSGRQWFTFGVWRTSPLLIIVAVQFSRGSDTLLVQRAAVEQREVVCLLPTVHCRRDILVYTEMEDVANEPQ